MTSARPAPCFITIYTTDGGVINTDTEQMEPESRKDMSDPKAVLMSLAARLKNSGYVTFTHGSEGAMEAVFAQAVQRIVVTPE